MKRMRRFGMNWWELTDADHRYLLPRFGIFILFVPFLLWLFTLVTRWLFSNLTNN